MEIIIQPTAAAASALAAKIVARLLREKRDAVLGLAAGATPLLLYQELVRMKLDWRRVTTFNMDDYIGLSPKDARSFQHFMWDNLLRHTNIQPKNVHAPDGMARVIPKSCADYEARIRAAGGIDLQVLGIGTDGHIGFNEPGSSLTSRTRLTTLAAQTRRDHAHLFGGEAKVPVHAVTMGIGTILNSQECLLLAFGRKKSRVVAAAVEGPVTAMVPASALQLHPNVKLLLDGPAASRLKHADYYRMVYEHKPGWQNF